MQERARNFGKEACQALQFFFSDMGIVADVKGQSYRRIASRINSEYGINFLDFTRKSKIRKDFAYFLLIDLVFCFSRVHIRSIALRLFDEHRDDAG